MSKVMLYRHPRTIKGNDVNKGFTKVKGVEFDWIIVEDKEVEACLKQGFYPTTDEAIGAEDDVTETTPDLSDMSVEEIKEKYTVDELREIAKVKGIKRYSRMNEDTLVEKILGE